MQKSNSDSPTSDQLKLMKYLDQFDRQVNNRKSSVALEEQLASLSRAYNQAQEKLLQTEKALMTESILLQKQRSVIDIYKYALNEQLDEQGILFFLQKLEEDQSNRQIYDDIVEIRMIISRKKQKNMRRLTEQEKAARERKKEVSKLQEDRQEMEEENGKINQSMCELGRSNQELKEDLVRLRQSLGEKQAELREALGLLDEERVNSKSLQEEVKEKASIIERLKLKQVELTQLRHRSSQLQKCLSTKLSFAWSKNNQQSISDSVSTLQKKIDQLHKYKSQYKKLKENNEESAFLKKEVTLLKLYLSWEALQLFKELQLQRLDCIQTEIRNLAVLEKSRLLKLQDCQRDIWKYKIQLLREEQNNPNQANYLSQTSKHLPSSKNSEQTFTQSLKSHSSIPSHHISQFSG